MNFSFSIIYVELLLSLLRAAFVSYELSSFFQNIFFDWRISWMFTKDLVTHFDCFQITMSFKKIESQTVPYEIYRENTVFKYTN